MTPREKAFRDAAERGSALVLAIFVLVLLTSLGIALLTLSQVELRMARADTRAKAVFYVAEAGLEHGRAALLTEDVVSADPSDLDGELAAHAGANGAFDFDPTALRPTYDGAGNVTGFTGYGDDVPLLGPTVFEDGFYAAFLTNDPVDDGLDPLDDTNQRVLISAIGTGPGFATELVQAIVQRITFPGLPATITILGPDPEFDGGPSQAKLLSGNDCDGLGVPDLHVPVVGVIGPDAEADAEGGVHHPETFESGDDTGVDTVTDVDGTIHPLWKDCAYLRDLAAQVKGSADLVGDSGTPNGSLGTSADPKTVFIDGDYTIPGNLAGGGLLWVTGDLTVAGTVGWEGVIFVVGTGRFLRNGAGAGDYSGGFLVANIAGPDGTLWTADDCAGPDGNPGTPDDGIDSGAWEVNGAGAGTTAYCEELIDRSQQLPLRVDQFRQR